MPKGILGVKVEFIYLRQLASISSSVRPLVSGTIATTKTVLVLDLPSGDTKSFVVE